MTLDEIMAGKVPGSVKTCCQGSGLEFFTPYYRAADSYWYGTDSRRLSIKIPTGGDQWQIYTEPKKPVVRYLIADKNGHIHNQMLTEEEAVDYPAWSKLLWSRTEFPE